MIPLLNRNVQLFAVYMFSRIILINKKCRFIYVNIRYTQGVSKKYCVLKILTKENLLAIDCKHVLRAVSGLTFGSFTLYNYNFTIVSFLDVSKTLFNEVFESIYDYFLSQ